MEVQIHQDASPGVVALAALRLAVMQFGKVPRDCEEFLKEQEDKLLEAQSSFVDFVGSRPFLYKHVRFFDGFSKFFSSSTQNHAESFRNYLKKLICDPKRATFDPKSEFGHVRTCQGQSRRKSPSRTATGHVRIPIFV